MGGAHVAGIPYDQYIRMTGAEWFPGLQAQKVDYWAGQVQATPLERLFPVSTGLPGMGLDGPSIGESVDQGAGNVIATVNQGRRHGAGACPGRWSSTQVQARLAADPNAPPPDRLAPFAVFWRPDRYRVISIRHCHTLSCPPTTASPFSQAARTLDGSVLNAIVGLAAATAVAFTQPP